MLEDVRDRLHGVLRKGQSQGQGMSAMGQKQTFRIARAMSALPPKATSDAFFLIVCFGPIADMLASIRSPRRHVQ